MAGVSAERAFSSSDALLGAWAPWLGVLVFAVGVTIATLLRPGFPSLLVVLYAAWIGQVVGNALFGAYASGFTGALVMTSPPISSPAYRRRCRCTPSSSRDFGSSSPARSA